LCWSAATRWRSSEAWFGRRLAWERRVQPDRALRRALTSRSSSVESDSFSRPCWAVGRGRAAGGVMFHDVSLTPLLGRGQALELRLEVDASGGQRRSGWAWATLTVLDGGAILWTRSRRRHDVRNGG
jgi:hypothetical protein